MKLITTIESLVRCMAQKIRVGLNTARVKDFSRPRDVNLGIKTIGEVEKGGCPLWSNK